MTDAFDPPPDFTPLTVAEEGRLTALLDGVSTLTLLHSLLGLGRDSEDAHLIIAAVLGRLPPGAR